MLQLQTDLRQMVEVKFYLWYSDILLSISHFDAAGIEDLWCWLTYNFAYSDFSKEAFLAFTPTLSQLYESLSLCLIHKAAISYGST